MENNDFIIENGVLKKYIGSNTEVTIPDGVTEIGEYAFGRNLKLVSVTIPNGVTIISSAAFRDCEKLKTVILPESLTLIDEYAFYNCDKLKKINIPNNVEKISSWAFRHTGLTSVIIPNSVKKVDFAAFACCKNLRKVKILNDETCIMPDAFCGCPKLADENGFVIVKNVLWDYYGTDSEVTVPSVVSIIDNDLFSSSLSWESNLTSIILPDGLEIIGWRTFSFCKKLTSVIIPSSVKEICRGAFRYCENLKSVTIMNKDVEIGEETVNLNVNGEERKYVNNAFEGCKKLTIYAPANSTAEQFAKRNNIPFIKI